MSSEPVTLQIQGYPPFSTIGADGSVTFDWSLIEQIAATWDQANPQQLPAMCKVLLAARALT